MKIIAFWVCAALLTPGYAFAQDLDPLAGAIEARLSKSRAPGLTVAVVGRNGAIVERGYGVRSVETREPVVSGMLFRPGSSTKTWTAAALLKAMEQRKLSVRQPIGSFVMGLRPDLARLTVHQLLSHTSGLADSGATGGSLDDEALARSVMRVGSYPSFAEPGKIFSYSNPGYQLAGYVLEKLTGQKFADAMDALILRPLGAAHATYRTMVAITRPLSVGHEIDGKGVVTVIRPMDHGVVGAPSGYAFSTSSDLARFAQMILADGKAADGTEVLSASVIAAMTTRYATVTESAGTMGYGYGLWVDREKGRLVWYHGGGLEGFNTQVTMLPEKGVAIAAIANASGTAGLVNDVVNLVREQVDPSPAQPSRTTNKAGGKADRRREPVPEPLASQLVGKWGGGEYVFTVRKEERTLTYLVGNTVLGTLHKGDGDRLSLVSPGGGDAGYVGVVRGANGSPVYMTWGARATSRLPAELPASR